ncbi:MAG: 7-carboxy-7-deazaguanine synthase QueE [Planctomycetes bacterium]|nr:7-carboxy-7-deazaguanine synthase QueE [Planctomycetota bacterium]
MSVAQLPDGHLQELFASFQGEGATVGARTVFVRMAGCALRCRYCDTPKALVRTEFAEFHRPEGIERCRNPCGLAAVAAAVDQLDLQRRCWVSFTGGEPLEQAPFLAALAPLLRPRRLHLETAGVNAPEMALLAAHVDHVAFDLKLDSVAQEGDRTADHRSFLVACRGTERVAKMIVGPTTDVAEVGRLAKLVAEESPSIPLILQPETPRTGGFPELPLALLEACHAAAERHLRDVRVIPQTHKFLRLP